MKSNYFARVLCIVFIPFLVSGIIRHDVHKSKYLALAKKEQFKCVGVIHINSQSIGSGVLIKDNYVLTAAHNIIESDTRIDTINNNGNIFYVNTPINHGVVDKKDMVFEIEDKNYLIDTIILHPKYLQNIQEGIHDIAILKLAKSLENISPAKLNFSNDEKKSEVVGVGFGYFGIGNRKEVGPKKEMLAGQNVIDSIGGIKLNGLNTYLFCDFDHPYDASVNKMGSEQPMKLEYLSSAGDSGGGLFRKLNKTEWELVGICKGTELNFEQLKISVHYGQIMRWTRICAYQKWIVNTLDD